MLPKLLLVEALAALIGLHAVAYAEPLACEPESLPYLEVVFYQRETNFGPFPPRPNLREGHGAALVCRDRRVLGTAVQEDNHPGFESLPSRAIVARGRLEPSNWSRLSSAAATIRIGFMTSCNLQLHPILGLVDARITWHGKHGRTNSFRLSSFDSSMRGCSPDEEDFWLSLALLGELGPGGERVIIL